jgi:hypothetical protein
MRSCHLNPSCHDEDNSIQGYGTVYSRRSRPTLLISLMMKAVRTSETSVYFYETTLCDIPKDSYLHIHLSEDLKSHMV